jgi:hypothetical protein
MGWRREKLCYTHGVGYGKKAKKEERSKLCGERAQDL